MEENTEITQNSAKVVNKDELFDENGKFKKGHPKIGGKKLGSKHKPKFLDELEEMLDEIVEGKTYSYRKALKKQVLKRMIIDGDTTLLREYWQQRDGKPQSKITADIKIFKINDLLEKIYANNPRISTKKRKGIIRSVKGQIMENIKPLQNNQQSGQPDNIQAEQSAT